MWSQPECRKLQLQDRIEVIALCHFEESLKNVFAVGEKQRRLQPV
jgi:hypothetical protein